MAASVAFRSVFFRCLCNGLVPDVIPCVGAPKAQGNAVIALESGTGGETAVCYFIWPLLACYDPIGLFHRNKPKRQSGHEGSEFPHSGAGTNRRFLFQHRASPLQRLGKRSWGIGAAKPRMVRRGRPAGSSRHEVPLSSPKSGVSGGRPPSLGTGSSPFRYLP